MPKGLRAVPRAVWALGFVSMFMDVSSEMIHSLLPVFLVSSLGASTVLVGLIEGISETTVAITKVFSGWLSDRLGRRKLLAVIGYGLAAATKPVFPLAASPMQVLGARVVDRFAKGMRGAPRDALIADITPKALTGAAFGLRQSLDTVGAVGGPLLAMGLMVLLSGHIRAVFAWAVVPGAIAVLLLLFGVEEPDRAETRAEARAPIRWAEVRGMGAGVWTVVAVGVVFTLARFSEAFLVLRAQNVGLPVGLVPLIMVVMNVVYASVSAPVGSLSDRIGRRALLAAGLAVLVAADLVLALFASVPGALAGAALWGLHLGLTQGLFSALIADAAPARLRGTAFGVFNLATGVALLAASALAGEVWDHAGPAATFLTGGGLALATLLAVAAVAARSRPRVE
ncbi:MAG: MFS transporter [Caulobacteraceae bacterium]|nr:MFS transporter [Caulobacteraceae bacterium]